jgi:hypothetical protein
MNIYFYKHVHSTPINTSERLSQLYFKIYEVGHQERITIDENVVSDWKNN